MQIFVRFGQPLGTLTLDLDAADTFRDVKDKLALRSGQPAEHMRLLYAGRQLDDSSEVSSVCSQSSTLQLSSRLLGGGGDGGATGAESRSSYLEMYKGKKNDKVNPLEQLLGMWTRCHLSGDTLAPPVVADELGFVYNKDAVVNALLHKTMPASLGHITSLKHVVDLKLEKNTNRGSGSAGPSVVGNASAPTAGSGNVGPSNESDFVCPISGVEFNGRFKFFVHRPTGHVVSEKAMKDAPAVVAELLGCKPSNSDLTPVNPTGEALDAMYERVSARLAAEREKKKKKKNNKQSSTPVAAVADGGGSPSELNNNAALSAKVEDKDAPVAKKAKHVVTEGSSVYKSIFTSSQPAMKETYCCRSTGARAFR